MDTLYIVIPAYNEQANIEEVVNDWYPVIEERNDLSRLVIIDDGSRDDTYKVLEKLAASREKMVALTKPNGGHGATVLYGYNYALEHGADFVFQTDSDGQTLASEFGQFWDLKDAHDMVIGHRKGRQDGFSRKFVTKTLKLVCRICFGVTLTDANTPFRLMKAEGLKENLKYVPKDFNLSNVILSVIYAKRKQSVKYIPITFRPRQGGVNSINLKRIFRIGKQALKDFKTINNQIKDIDTV
ncbi:MAG: glycosyltransferase family 2 protein [Lachnospiraceae bacterium]|nr:glycosyltransferase family 2 protein [Lachnospiraceae bacterium]